MTSKWCQDGALGRPRPRNQGSAQSGHAQSRSIRAALDLLALGVAFRSGPEEPRSKGRRGTAPGIGYVAVPLAPQRT
ncbi:hypothetical protein VFPFJ_03356 [Purpureocillium lilacinum]|uniref:Uncharacterized protein n=1 Tax=Purpureocillium lilacinum TaxID=33203 RepID=A0A179GWE6_PURLI|nr:hypothetical protein VFPFJ_03356 [Purpureocillium lilacinum]OAQ81561.1 hypothetical protein VFPBJ_04145 [Purpureocillium lilacinum]OAQ91616.1 hypothetical protein VFPFJ_03356 [Purpureocillium lilacinum]